MRKESGSHEVVASPKVPLYGMPHNFIFMARQNACEIENEGTRMN